MQKVRFTIGTYKDSHVGHHLYPLNHLRKGLAMTIQVATPEQLGKFCQLVGQKDTPSEQFQKLFSGGFLADLLDANIDQVDRNEFRKLLGLKPAIQEASVYPTPFRRGLIWRQRIEGKFDYIDPEIWQCIDSFVAIEDEDEAPLNIELDHFGSR